MNTNKIEPPHYKGQNGQLWQDMIKLYGVEAFINFAQLNAFKYRMRAGKKDGESAEEDIKKALWYEERIKELT